VTKNKPSEKTKILFFFFDFILFDQDNLHFLYGKKSYCGFLGINENKLIVFPGNVHRV